MSSYILSALCLVLIACVLFLSGLYGDAILDSKALSRELSVLCKDKESISAFDKVCGYEFSFAEGKVSGCDCHFSDNGEPIDFSAKEAFLLGFKSLLLFPKAFFFGCDIRDEETPYRYNDESRKLIYGLTERVCVRGCDSGQDANCTDAYGCNHDSHGVLIYEGKELVHE